VGVLSHAVPTHIQPPSWSLRRRQTWGGGSTRCTRGTSLPWSFCARTPCLLCQDDPTFARWLPARQVW